MVEINVVIHGFESSGGNAVALYHKQKGG